MRARKILQPLATGLSLVLMGCPALLSDPPYRVGPEADAGGPQDASTNDDSDAAGFDATGSGDGPGDGSDATGSDATGSGGCGSAEQSCGGRCVPNDMRNCGSCGNTCPASSPLCGAAGSTYACTSQCPSGARLCGSACVDTATNASNCGGCGRACDTRTGTPSCATNTCLYACAKGRADCNSATAPNTDGCECATPGCCGTGCETTHSNGTGQSFYDCAAVATYDQTQATEACAAFTGSAGACTQSTGCCGPGCPFRGASVLSVCGSAAGACNCWQYSGANVGRVQTVTGSCSAACGSTGDPSWN